MLEVQDMPIEDLIPYAGNARKHGPDNVLEIAASITEYGFNDPIAINENNNVIIEGHGRLMAAKHLGMEKVPVLKLGHLSPAQIKGYTLIHNRLAEKSEWDKAILETELAKLADMNFDLTATGFGPSDLTDMDIDLGFDTEPGSSQGGNTDEDEVPEVEENPYGVKLGDIWLLGKHRLMCGDSTDKATVDRLMDGAKADMVFTSPPYNSGDGGYKTDYNGSTKKFYKSKVDDRTEQEWVDFCNDVFNAIPISNDSSPVIWNIMYTARCRAGYGLCLFGSGQPYNVKETICWDKNKGFPSASKGILSRNWELIFVLSKGDKYFTTQGTNEVRFNRWDIDAGNQRSDHHATFPVALAERALNDFSNAGFAVYEPFCGSGSTLIACEKTGRQCFGMEIDPHYCSVIIQRYIDYVGDSSKVLLSSDKGDKTIEEVLEMRKEKKL